MKEKCLIKTFVLISWFLLGSSVRLGLFQSYRNYQNQNLKAADSNDELGGSLIDVVAPTPDQNTNLFDVPPSKEQQSTIVTSPNIAEVIDKVNTPASTEKAPPKTEPGPEPTSEPESVPEPSPPPKAAEPSPQHAPAIQPIPVPVPVPAPSPKPEIANLQETTEASKLKSRMSALPAPVITQEPCKYTFSRDIHAPFPVPETTNMRYYAILVIIIFGSVFIILRSLYHLLKNINKFFAKGMRILANQVMFFLICLVVLICFYTFGLLDVIPINWEYFIAAIALFLVSWIIFCAILLLLSLFVMKKWENLEKNARDYRSVKKQHDVFANENYGKEKDVVKSDIDYIEVFDFLVLKRYFLSPVYPVFRASVLRKEIKFTVYLKYCFVSMMRLLFKVSWTCWVVTIASVLIWSVFIAPCDILIITIVMFSIPSLGLVICLVIYIYMKVIYRRVVEGITQSNIHKYNDMEYDSSLPAEVKYPVYLRFVNDSNMVDKAMKPKISFHDHFHNRTPSLYEDQMAFGATGFYLTINTLQTVGFLFIAWSILLFMKHYSTIYSAYGEISLMFTILIYAFYFIFHCLLIILGLKWFTLIASIEMKRNEKCLKKTIHYHLKQAAEISESILNSYKKLYYDIKNHNRPKSDAVDIFSEKKEEAEFKVGIGLLQKLIRVSMARFKKNNTDDIKDLEIDVQTELRPFLKSCGNNLTSQEVEFMMHMIERYDDFNGKLKIDHLFDIYGAILQFRQLRPHKIVEFVFNYYYKENEGKVNKDLKNLNKNNILEFTDYYKHYFNNEQRQYMTEEAQYLGADFSLDAFIQNILGARQYHPY